VEKVPDPPTRHLEKEEMVLFKVENIVSQSSRITTITKTCNMGQASKRGQCKVSPPLLPGPTKTKCRDSPTGFLNRSTEAMPAMRRCRVLDILAPLKREQSGSHLTQTLHFPGRGWYLLRCRRDKS
jgi:hypothetical protein